jgi:glycosyltransferase involved in cell wall biosynthesis
MPDCRVSVIVPARNAASFLRRCLTALRAEPSDDFEILVVDDASTDETPAIAESMGARVIRLESVRGPSGARNVAAREARGKYLFFVDSDVVVRPGAVKRVGDLLDRDPRTTAVFGSYDAEPEARTTLSQYRNLLHHWVHQNGRPAASTFWAGCGAVRRQVFLHLGGFDETAYPRPCIEDIELGYRLRESDHRILLDRDLLCTHLKRWTLGSWIKTDVFCRAIPWARLNFERKVSPDDLNIKKSQKLSVALTALGMLLLPLALLDVAWLAVAGLVFAATVAINARLFRFFHERRGTRFALACVLFHHVYFLYSGLSYLYVWGSVNLRRGARETRVFGSTVNVEQ